MFLSTGRWIRTRQGFTLIELMIVVAIIAVIAAIAIPNLLQSRMQANETTAIAALKTYHAGQVIYQRSNYSGKNGLGPRMFAPSFANMGGAMSHLNGSGNPIGLISDPFADATKNTGYQGYFFVDATQALDGSVALNLNHQFGLYAHACLYEASGINSFAIFYEGTVFMADPGADVAVGTENPGVAAANWLTP